MYNALEYLKKITRRVLVTRIKLKERQRERQCRRRVEMQREGVELAGSWTGQLT